MNRKSIIIALVVSMVVSFFLWKRIQSAQDQKPIFVEPPKIPTKDVLVAKRRIPTRTRLEPAIINEFVELAAKNASDVPADAFVATEALLNKYTSMPILPGDILTPDRVLDKDAVPNLSFAVPTGKRAVTIQAGPIIGVAGFVQQNDFVDIIATFRPPGGQTISKLVLQDIQVLAVGKTYFQDLTTGVPGSPTAAIMSQLTDLITLAVSPDELEKLVFLDSGVQFRLVLKNPKDKDKTINTRGATEKIVMEQVVTEQRMFEINAGTTTTVATTAEQPAPPPPTIVTTAPATEETLVQKPFDDGKVEIFYGRKIKEEIFKDGYEADQPPPTRSTAVSRQSPAPARPSSFATPYGAE